MKTIETHLAKIASTIIFILVVIGFWGVTATLPVSNPDIRGTITMTANFTGWNEFGVSPTLPTRNIDPDTKVYELKFASVDYSTLVDTGNRLRTKQNGVWTHSLIVKNWLVGSDTILAVYTGSDVADSIGDTGVSAITDIEFSRINAQGFPGQDHWTETVVSNSSESQVSPTATQYYNLPNLNMDLPFGAWNFEYYLAYEIGSDSSLINVYALVTFGATAAAAGYDDLTCAIDVTAEHDPAGSNRLAIKMPCHRKKYIEWTGGRIYCNVMTGVTNIAFIRCQGSATDEQTVRAISAYY